MGLFGMFNKSGEKNMGLAADYTKEETYRVSNLYITLNVGVLSASSFIFSSINLAKSAKIFVPLLFLSLISIILEIFIRKNTLKILRAGSAEKMNHADKYNTKLAEAFRNNANDAIKCSEEMAKVAIAFNAENLGTNASISSKIQPYLRLRVWSEVMIFTAVFSLLLVALSQLGILQALLTCVAIQQ